MPKACKKCDPHEICEECPEWIFTLADLIMCMMGLFVVLWVLKPSPTPPPMGTDGEPNKEVARQTEVINGIIQVVGYGKDPPQPSSGEADDKPPEPKPPRKTGDDQKGTQHERQEAAEGTDPQVQSIREGKQSDVGARVDFARGEAALTADDARILDQIAQQIVGIRYVVIVKGHAARDDFGENAAAALMDISLRRAQAAADYLMRHGVSPDILRVQGCSTFEPVRQRAYSPDGQAPNRRVEVFTTDVTVRDLEDPRDASVRPLD